MTNHRQEQAGSIYLQRALDAVTQASQNAQQRHKKQRGDDKKNRDLGQVVKFPNLHS